MAGEEDGMRDWRWMAGWWMGVDAVYHGRAEADELDSTLVYEVWIPRLMIGGTLMDNPILQLSESKA